MSIVVLRQAVDWFQVSLGGKVREVPARALHDAKLRAQETEQSQYAPLGGLDFAVRSHGSKPYKYVLAGDDAEILATDSDKLPGASVRITAQGLAAYEPLPFYEWLREIVAENLGPGAPEKMSRLDIAVDFQGLNMADLHGARFVCPAQFRPVYPNIEHPETYHFGKHPLMVRVYNKTKEIAKSGKTWLFALWEQHPDYTPGQDVWRFEVEIGRKVLRQLECDTPQQTCDKLPDLLNYALSWCDLRIPQGKSSDRWPRHPAWVDLADASGSHTLLTREELARDLASIERIVPVVAGYAISAGARLDCCDFDQVWRILGPKVRAQVFDDYAAKVRTRQIERLG